MTGTIALPPAPSKARVKAVEWALARIGEPVVMGHRGQLRFDRATRTLVPHGLGLDVWDCSAIAAGATKAGGGPDMLGTHNAQLLHDGARELRPNEGPYPADLVFYGTPIFERDANGQLVYDDAGLRKIKVPAERNISHVVLWLAGGHCISADGATWGITSLEQARAARCEVRLHKSIHYRLDCSYVRARRNVWLDAVDGVSR